MYFIVGLGNPTRAYQATRHNVGFDAVTALSDQYRIPLDLRRHLALLGKGNIAGQRVLLAQPQTFMNASGNSVRALLDFYKAAPEQLIVIYDDISLPCGRLRVRKQGSAGGHNGMKSIISQLGTDVFIRIRIGIGAPPEGHELADYVTARFSREEEPVIRQALKAAADACTVILSEGIDAAMTRFNAAPAPKE